MPLPTTVEISPVSTWSYRIEGAQVPNAGIRPEGFARVTDLVKLRALVKTYLEDAGLLNVVVGNVTLLHDYVYFNATFSEPETAAPLPVFPEDFAPDEEAGAPANGAEEVPADPEEIVLAWPEVPNAVQYQINFGNDPAPGVLAVVAVVSILLGDFVGVNLDNGELYYWQVVAINADGVAVAGPVWNFRVEDGEVL